MPHTGTLSAILRGVYANTGLAADLTHDPHKGIDCGDIFKRLQDDKRVLYLIFNGHIWSKERGLREYEGSNKHVKHLHI